MTDSRVQVSAHLRRVGDEPPDSDVEIPALAQRTDAMSVFFAWEKLRIVYNLLLIALVVIELGIEGTLITLPLLFGGAVAANICFCVGPVAEGYLCCIGVERIRARLALFALGMILSLALTWGILSSRLPWLNFP